MDDGRNELNCVFQNENALFLSFMTFVKDGGLFVRTKHTYQLDDQVTLLLTFFDEPEVHRVLGRVVWITPQGAQGNKMAGVGVQFLSENKRQICNKIETYLAGRLKSVLSTDTM